MNRDHLLRMTGSQRFGVGLRLVVSLLDGAERLRILFLVVSMSFNAVIGLIAVSSIMPFIYLVIADQPLVGDSLPARIFRLAGIYNTSTALFTFGGIVVMLAGVKAIYSVFHSYSIDIFTSRLEARMTTSLLKKITTSPYQWVATKNSAILRELALDRSSEWARIAVRLTLQLLGDIIFLGGSLVVIVLANPKEGLLVISAAIALSIMLLHLSKKSMLRQAEKKRLSSRASLLCANDAIMGGRDVRISKAGELLVNAFKQEKQRFSYAEARGRLFSALPRQISEVIGVGALIALGLSMIVSGVPKSEVSSVLILYALIVMRALPVLSQVVGGIASLYSVFPSCADLCEFESEVTKYASSNGVKSMDVFKNWKKLNIKNVNFSYLGTDQLSLKKINLVINRGDRIGVVGLSGAGKSTLIDMVVGLIHPTSGQVFIDNSLLTRKEEAAWQAQIGYVSQTPFILDGTLLDNVTLGFGDHLNDEILCTQALEKAGLRDFLSSLPNGINSQVGDYGSRLSGGQRQRLAIARALYRNASILILDEATSALDALTEQEIMDGIFEFGADVTVIIVAHRISLVQKCQRIVVLDKGSVVAEGGHSDLIQHAQLYKDLSRGQLICE